MEKMNRKDSVLIFGIGVYLELIHCTHACNGYIRTLRLWIHLTPYDLKLLNFAYPQRGLLFSKPDEETHIIPKLKASLSTALDIYFSFTGRLIKIDNPKDNTVSYYVDCDCSGAKFIHAKAEHVSINHFLQLHDSGPNFTQCFFPANDLKSSDGISESLLLLQVTKLKDRVFISFGYNHMVADGSSFWNFLHTWSSICLNGSSSHIQPLVLKDLFIEGEEEYLRTQSENQQRDMFFRLKISSLQAVLAHLWLSIIKESHQNRVEDQSHIIVAVDMRRRLNPPLDTACFGNVTHQGMATARVGEILDHGLGWAALQINEKVRSLTNDNYKTFAETWFKNVKLPQPKISGGPRKADTYLVVRSSPWLEVYDNDFGWGKPIAVRSEPNNGFGVSLVVFRGVEEGSIDVHATIPLSIWSDIRAGMTFRKLHSDAAHPHRFSISVTH
ncbi:unnamed protein product [Eruca vesicaria subsp. sativa]|uniref:Uncharacterized protein n=1 Tax=Eruca vesicaria subsp. sativa TaxID=29727 RepID=A0ABC8LPZ8_ERUVS|nr:unnamed protein product [Eruca vesicaria subsp. sativa]